MVPGHNSPSFSTPRGDRPNCSTLATMTAVINPAEMYEDMDRSSLNWSNTKTPIVQIIDGWSEIIVSLPTNDHKYDDWEEGNAYMIGVRPSREICHVNDECGGHQPNYGTLQCYRSPQLRWYKQCMPSICSCLVSPSPPVSMLAFQ